MKKINELKIVFFGTGPLAESALTTLIESGISISYLITKPDRPVGRKQEIESPHIKHIAESFGIPTLQPESIKKEIPAELLVEEFDLFIVASYGNLIPDAVLDIPIFGTLNIHPSLLPLYRGPTPIETALKNGDKTFGISIMFLDDKVDHGPILAQKVLYAFDEIQEGVSEDFERLAGVYGASMLVDGLLEDFVGGAISVAPQDHALATFTKKFTKEDGLVSLSDSPEHMMNVYRACTPWPGCYFIHTHHDTQIRVKINEMKYIEQVPTITIVTPEGKKQMSWKSFQNGYMK
ncbi:MAG: methionyl-tRNA formyltransferase [Candidatus Parcubacteria bacterium]|jgi:methionyl-tRNA formyltransferase